MYMSYCRFEGTRHELNACISEVEEHINEEAEYEVSDHEIRHFRQMIQEFVEFMDENELLDEYGELDNSKLDDICEAMSRGYGEEY